MLHAFGVKNYYNLNMEDPAVFQNGVSFVYGICGSGKTNLCRALGDIIEISPDSRGQKSPDFIIIFPVRDLILFMSMIEIATDGWDMLLF